MSNTSEIRNPELWESGARKIQWVKQNMPLLRGIEKEFSETKPFAGVKIALSVHLEAKTAYLCKVLAAGGAEMYVTGSNPLSTQDDVAAALVHDGLNVFAWYNATDEEYHRHISQVIKARPNVIIDDGGDLVNLIHNEYPELIPEVLGGCEETTTGIIRLKAMDRDGALKFPMVLVNDADCKHLFDNRYGTGQSVWDGINRTTNLIVAGKNVVVAGYGWCGKGVAMRAKGLGADVIVTEIDPIKAMEAVMDGFKVMPMREAAKVGDFFVTVTGCADVIGEEAFLNMKDGAICCNAGHFDVEVNMAKLREIAQESYPHSYVPDNEPVEYTINCGEVTLTPPATRTGQQHRLVYRLADEGAEVELCHEVKNVSGAIVTLAPWALTVCAAGGVEIFPQSVKDNGLLSNRRNVFWSYSDINDDRFFLGNKYGTLQQVKGSAGKFKIGMNNEDGWAAVVNHGQIFLKNFCMNIDGEYPDYGCYFETFTNGIFLECESLGEIKPLKNGEALHITEYWSLISCDDGFDRKSEESIDAFVKKHDLRNHHA